MEGRMRRENLTQPGRAANSGPNASPPSVRYTKSAGRSGGGRYRKRRYPAKSELIPQGRDLLIVQLLASGLLLLFVMFIAIVDTDGTVLIRQKLHDAFSRITTVAELSHAVQDVREKLTGGTDTVFEIFGGELNDDVPSTDAETDSIKADISPQKELIDNEEAAIDPETLKQLTEYAEDYSKN